MSRFRGVVSEVVSLIPIIVFWIVLVAGLTVILDPPAVVYGAGTVTVTARSTSPSVIKYTIAWTSTSGGAVSGNTLGISAGEVFQVLAVPGSGATQPTDLYDLQLNTPTGTVNILGTAGDNLSQTTSKVVQLVPPYYHDATGELDLVIANAGNAKTGTVIVWVRQ